MKTKQKREKNKKALEMAFNSIVIIIISLVILAALLFMFTKSSSVFSEKIMSYFSSSNVDFIKTYCNDISNRGETYEYCCVSKIVKLSSKQKLELTCSNASMTSWGSDINKLDCGGIC